MFDAIIVGAGLAGLSCAHQLERQGRKVKLFEVADGVGGRIRTDWVQGFQLDRGFQVYLESYPDARQVLDHHRLQLKPFLPGALIRYRGKFYPLADPWRQPLAALGSVLTPIGSFRDKLRIASFRSRVLKKSVAENFQLPETTAMQSLRNSGFSDQIIDTFFRPFLGGIFLDQDLQTSSRMLDFVFRMFSTGNATLPATGMGAIPRQLAGMLQPDTIQLNTSVISVSANLIQLANGQTYRAKSVVIATEAPVADRLLNRTSSPSPPSSPSGNLSTPINVSAQGVTCLYFSAAVPPTTKPVLILNGDATGPINNLAIPTNVAPSYGPPGSNLISVTVLGNRDNTEQVLEEVRHQLHQWYGSVVKDWQHLKTYVIPYALPTQSPPALAHPERPIEPDRGIFICGDHRDNASINGAIVSGQRTARAILER